MRQDVAVRVTRTAAAVFSAALVGSAVWGGAAAGASSQWTTYHADDSRSGMDSSEPSLNPLRAAWSSPLDGVSVYGQPVVAAGRVFVATEGDNVYALDAHDGRILWQRHIGQPLQNVQANTGCGDIDPLGITSTPVVDISRSTVYVVGEVSNAGNLPVGHQLVGFNIYTGAVTRSVSADPVLPAGENLKQLQQRASLAVANGRVYVGFGGLAGDCGTYHGWLVGVDEAGGRPSVQFDVTPQSTGGAIWMGGGGPSVDAAGNLYVTTGNINAGPPAPWSESVVKLPPGLGTSPLAHFQDAQATGDADLGTGDATLVSSGEMFAVGKTDIGYLLRQSNLTQIAAIPGVCGGHSDPDGGEAYDAALNSIYVPCQNNTIQQVNLATHMLGWRGGSANGAPILVDGELWTAQYGGSALQQLEPVHGGILQTIDVGATMPTFTSPTAADGLLLVGTDAGVEAFDGPAGPPPPAPPPPRPTQGYWLTATDGGVFSFGTAGFHGSLGGVRLNAPIVGLAPTPSGRGYWLVGADGGVFSFGDASFFGSTGAIRLNQPVVGIAPTPTGRGYWLVARDGGVFSFGDARFHGSLGAIRLNAPIVATAPAPSGSGYWLVGSDGGVFTFGTAHFYGSTGHIRLNQPITGMAATPTGQGYWLAARDGGVFTFGNAGFHGSLGGVRLNAPVVAVARPPKGSGYWLIGSDGGVFTFGTAAFEGSTGGVALHAPIDGAAAET
jgi:hypothetical protein